MFIGYSENRPYYCRLIGSWKHRMAVISDEYLGKEIQHSANFDN